MALPGRVHERVVAEHVGQLGPQRPRGPLPPLPGRLGDQPGRVRQQLRDRGVARPRAGQMLAERVGERQQPLVTQAQHLNRDERLGDRADPVLQIPVGRPAVDRAPPVEPHRVAVAHHGGDDGRRPPLHLAGRQAVDQGTSRFGHQLS